MEVSAPDSASESVCATRGAILANGPLQLAVHQMERGASTMVDQSLWAIREDQLR